MEMDATALLREKIPNFPGYGDEDARRLSDELVRAYAGELLANLQRRVEPPGNGADRLSKVLLRCEFANQVALKQYEHANLDPSKIEAVAMADLQMINIAEKSRNVDGFSIDAYLDQVEAALDLRDREMESAPA